MGGTCGSAETLVCFECVCLTWKGLIGMGLPLAISLLYMKRVVKEASFTDWVLMLVLAFMTWGTKEVTERGVSHMPWYLVFVGFLGIFACTTERVSRLPSIPMIGVFAFLSLLMADVASMIHSRPDGMYGAPGGQGIIDGLIIKPLAAVGLLYLAYVLKVWPIAPKKERRGKVYDQQSKDFLLNLSPFYERPDAWDTKLRLVPKELQESRAAAA
jgi:hypothetical protein